MGGINRRLDKLETLLPARDTLLGEWPLEDQLEGVLDALQAHSLGRSVYLATDRELELLDALIEQGVVPEGARELFTRMNPAKQPERERWLRENWRQAKVWREQSAARVAWHREHGWDKPTPKHLLLV